MDETNNPVCNYDGGDCCVVNANLNSCSERACHFLETCVAGYHPLVGNGVCNDNTNIAECDYDGGDCCVNVNTDSCSDCNCLRSGVITSPGFPGNYDNNLDLNWHIHFAVGKLIEVTFNHFDVEYEYNCG